VTYEVKGGIGSSTGKRLLVPANLFEANSKPKFPETKRDLPIDMHYPSSLQDAVRLKLPGSLAVESAPAPSQAEMKGSGDFETANKAGPGSMTFFRNVVIGKSMFPVTEYPALHDFYSKLAAKDQETLVLTRRAATGSSGGGEK